MSNYINKDILLVGAGPMAVEYAKVLMHLDCSFEVIGRGAESSMKFEESTKKKVHVGGLEKFVNNNKQGFEFAIVSVGVEKLADITIALLEMGIKNILVEKPAGLNFEEIQKVAVKAKEKTAKVLVAYNRRFYSSVEKAIEIIKEDGGVASFNFEFTEWSNKIKNIEKAPGVKENWLLANSTHVIDLAFFLGGKPKEMSTYSGGSLEWHDKAIFSGAGISEMGALFSYQANWTAPGRWVVEVLTKKHRLYFKPMESLQIQEIDSVQVNPVSIDDEIDKKFKPGIYKQVENFLSGQLDRFCTIEEQVENVKLYEKIAGR
ncbi:MAG: Gfo/Idh/MocA family oxidoreductase [Sporocytophaga sp.]|uniref:Gfo/Idh/MocA family oxidoreductase n=1 Tax=Sporocytophaga sp. TaxID=2231183 RepID=UPI001B1D010F|nr:Gfo/Idh/MocA family oxidoreductase [Sporocytophaga sp.]MBO9698637.1 Gfo/Idh/MocA family oxidoreductase [Sporocytophaga sp.]